ncbi:hypothetical protein KIN20_029056 [Parelaphostrongylus tenuis]|uniref:Uncharacterized protein n=1 Tax=Parelaphostrongylus tenuis TaxID=148309 RepID=A0AAD5R1P8_PARTN|nr:hypothetical protein KIN20_029056 [Parelaphostrongylus tenuis]
MNEVEREGTTRKSAAGRWPQRFNAGDLDLEDKPRSECLIMLNNEDWIASLEDEPSVPRPNPKLDGPMANLEE